MDRHSLQPLGPSGLLDQIFFIRRCGGAVIKTRAPGFAVVQVGKGVPLGCLGIGRDRSSLSGLRSGVSREVDCGLNPISVLPAKLVHVLRQPCVGDHDANLLEPHPYIFQAVTGRHELADLWPRLSDLPSLRARLFLRLRAESSEIKFVGGFSGHEDIVRRFPRSLQNLSNKFPESFQQRTIYRRFP